VAAPWFGYRASVAVTTAAELLLARADDDAIAFCFEEQRWTYRQLVEEAARRVALFESRHDRERPPHVGVLLDNVPDYLFWLAAAAVSGTVVVGINSTYRGEQLAQLIRHTECQFLVTSKSYIPLIEDVQTGVEPERILLVDEEGYRSDVAQLDVQVPERAVAEDDLFLLIFTSGSTGLPKAVRCTQGRYGRTGGHVAAVAQLAEGDAVYASLPFFHSSSLFTGWASAIAAGVPFATRTRFSASGTLQDVRRYGATMLTYTGKVLNYVLATTEAPDDADSPLRLAIGNEASLKDIQEFARRFGCTVRDSYGSTEGIIIIRRDPSMPDGALGSADPSVKVLDAATGGECPPVEFGPDGRPSNLAEAIGEIVETEPASGFEGYYKNEDATSDRFREGSYWSGDLAYRDKDGWFYFAGRSNEWLRVDSENFAAAPVEAIVARFPGLRSVAVYAVPDDPVGDRVMAAIEMDTDLTFAPDSFDDFLDAQPDLGTKWRPSFVRVMSALPKLASMKIDKERLRHDAWRVDQVFWRPNRYEPLREVDESARRRLDPLLG
jgi:fatty-acyl-CoA synthase